MPEGQALAAARDLAASLSHNAPLALAATKQIITESADWPAAEAFARQGEIAGPVFGSADAMEGAAAFAEKKGAGLAGRVTPAGLQCAPAAGGSRGRATRAAPGP